MIPAIPKLKIWNWNEFGRGSLVRHDPDAIQRWRLTASARPPALRPFFVLAQPRQQPADERVAFARLFPDSGESGFLPWGRSKRVSAMTRKVITLEFVVPTVLSIVIAVVLTIGAVYLTNIYLGPIEQVEADYSAVGRN
jgi:hypothetical protein